MKKLIAIAVVVMLGGVSAIAGTISAPQFNDGGGNVDAQFFPSANSATFITLKNNTGSTQTYSVLYFSLDGVNRTPTNNTFTIGANSARGWRPVADDSGGEGTGVTIPNASGSGGAGSATILYTDSIDPSGRVQVNAGGVNASFGFALFPAQ